MFRSVCLAGDSTGLCILFVSLEFDGGELEKTGLSTMSGNAQAAQKVSDAACLPIGNEVSCYGISPRTPQHISTKPLLFSISRFLQSKSSQPSQPSQSPSNNYSCNSCLSCLTIYYSIIIIYIIISLLLLLLRLSNCYVYRFYCQ